MKRAQLDWWNVKDLPLAFTELYNWHLHEPLDQIILRAGVLLGYQHEPKSTLLRPARELLKAASLPGTNIEEVSSRRFSKGAQRRGSIWFSVESTPEKRHLDITLPYHLQPTVGIVGSKEEVLLELALILCLVIELE